MRHHQRSTTPHHFDLTERRHDAAFKKKCCSLSVHYTTPPPGPLPTGLNLRATVKSEQRSNGCVSMRMPKHNFSLEKWGEQEISVLLAGAFGVVWELG